MSYHINSTSFGSSARPSCRSSVAWVVQFVGLALEVTFATSSLILAIISGRKKKELWIGRQG